MMNGIFSHVLQASFKYWKETYKVSLEPSLSWKTVSVFVDLHCSSRPMSFYTEDFRAEHNTTGWIWQECSKVRESPPSSYWPHFFGCSVTRYSFLAINSSSLSRQGYSQSTRSAYIHAWKNKSKSKSVIIKFWRTNNYKCLWERQ